MKKIVVLLIGLCVPVLIFCQTAQDYSNYGLIKSKNSDYSGAIEDYNKAINLDPRFAEAYNRRGNAKRNLQDLNGALADYNKAIALDPKYAKPYNNRGLLEIQLGHKEQGCLDLQKAAELGFQDANENIKMYCQKSNLNDPQSWQIFDHSNYRISFPNSWHNAGSLMGAEFALAPITPSNPDWTENINLFIENSGTSSFYTYISLTLAQLRKSISDFNLLDSKFESGKTGNFQKIIYTGSQGELKLKWLQNIYVSNGKAYILTFTAKVGDFETQLDIAQKILSTFTIKN
jgi:tetratricopeptide (TPR) repeat protein